MSVDDSVEKLKVFKDIVLSGLCCGLEHPIEWCVNLGRDMSIPYDKISERDQLIYECLREFFEAEHLRKPANDEEVREWVERFYKRDEKNKLEKKC